MPSTEFKIKPDDFAAGIKRAFLAEAFISPSLLPFQLKVDGEYWTIANPTSLVEAGYYKLSCREYFDGKRLVVVAPLNNTKPTLDKGVSSND